MTTSTETVFGLYIADRYYGTLGVLADCVKTKRSPKGRPITNEWIYRHYRMIMDNLCQWLLDEVVRMGYGTEFVGKPIRVIRLCGDCATLQISDCPFDCYWTTEIIGGLSDQFGFMGLWDQYQNDEA